MAVVHTEKPEGIEADTLTVEQAASKLGVSRAHAYRLAASGQIPSLKLGKRVVIPKGRLDRLLAGAQSA